MSNNLMGLKMRRPFLSRNHYFIIGLLLGLLLSFYIPQDLWELVQQEDCHQKHIAENIFLEKFGQDFEPHLNLINKPLAAKKPVKNVIRPRYYSSELGIREKLFVGVMTSQENINTLATAINRTAAHLVDKIKYFINADNVKTNYKLKNIVGFMDTRENLRPFHIIKYIADNYLNDYDYFLIIRDNIYVDVRKLKELLYHISITFDLYMGERTKIHHPFDNYDHHIKDNYNSMNDDDNNDINDNDNNKQFRQQKRMMKQQNSIQNYSYNDNDHNDNENNNDANNDDEFHMLGDRNYCDLDAGILLSSSVLRKMRNNLDWCVRNGITNLHTINIGRCVKYSSNINSCQESFQGMHQRTYNLKTGTEIFRDLNWLTKIDGFRNATTVYPVTNPDDFYRLHAYFSKNHLVLLQQMSKALEEKSYRIANGTISNNILEIRWPLGTPLSVLPETRHDIKIWHLLNSTHIFLPNDHYNIKPLTKLETLDLNKILEFTINYAKYKYPKLRYMNIHTIYRRFDDTRGMDYHVHLNFKDTTKSYTNHPNELIIKSFEVVKPLGRIEIIPSPYVTESTRIAILLPIFEYHIENALEFIQHYEQLCMQNQDNTFLLLIFIYHYGTSSKNDTDPFKMLKKLAIDLSAKYRTDGSRIAWLSIRLPLSLSQPITSNHFMYNSMYGPNELLSIAIADLALPKIGLDSLVLITSSAITYKVDFLNRIRMNTIEDFQIYSPIGFMQYPCNYVYFCNDCDVCDVSQSTGYFDRTNYDIISFYSRDYVKARKLLDTIVPIIRTDDDIINIFENHTIHQINNIFDMFIKSQLAVHMLRAVEPSLRHGGFIRNFFNTRQSSEYDLPICPAWRTQAYGVNNHTEFINCIHLASRKQIGDAIIRYEDRSIIQK